MFSSMPALMAEPTHDPGQALLYIIISGQYLPQVQLPDCKRAFAHATCLCFVAIQYALLQRQCKRNNQAVFAYAVILTAFAGIMSGLTLGLVRWLSVCLTWYCTTTCSLVHALICLLLCTDEHGRRRPGGTCHLSFHALQFCTGSLLHCLLIFAACCPKGVDPQRHGKGEVACAANYTLGQKAAPATCDPAPVQRRSNGGELNCATMPSKCRSADLSTAASMRRYGEGLRPARRHCPCSSTR